MFLPVHEYMYVYMCTYVLLALLSNKLLGEKHRPLWQLQPMQGNTLQYFLLTNPFYIFNFMSNI